MAATISRRMVNSRSSADGGTTPSDLFIRDVDEFIPYLERDDTPLVRMIPTGGSADKLKHEHGQGYLTPRTTTVTGAHNNSTTSFTFGNPERLQQYDILYYNGEKLWVQDAAPTNPVTVTRGYGGTTAVTFSGGETVQVLGPAVPEGVDSPSSPHTQGDLDWDTFQIFEYTWSLTHRAKHTPTYEFKSDRFKAMLKRYMTEAAIDLENFAIFGTRYLPANDSDATMTRGMIAATTANVTDLNGDPITLRLFLDGQQAVFQDVGLNDMGKTVILTPFLKRVVNSWFNPSRRSTTTDAKINMTFDSIDTDFGTYKFVIHHNQPTGYMNILNLKDIKRMTYEGGNWSTGMFATQGWYDRGFLRGDFGFIWPAARRRSMYQECSETAGDYPDLDVIFHTAA